MILGEPQSGSVNFQGYTNVIDPTYYNVNLLTITPTLSACTR
jgi:hypothetical protein